MDFIQACGTAVALAREISEVVRVYQYPIGDYLFYAKRDSLVNDNTGWLYQVYPGGRKVLSLAGVDTCKRLGIRLPN